MEDIEFKFNCDECDFHANYESLWLKHTNTELHKTGKRKSRSDKRIIHQCPKCEYKLQPQGNTNMKQHILNEHGTKEDREKGFKYYCKYCDYGTFAKPLYTRHNNTEKHKHIAQVIEEMKN